MAGETIHVTDVTQGFPAVLDGDELTTVDLTVDGKYVRVGYPTADLSDSAAVETKLRADADVLTNPDKQHDSQFPPPAYGTDRPDLVPADFVL